MDSKNNQVELSVKFQQAVQLQQGGNPQDAELTYKDILEIQPLHTGANTMLGIIYVETERENEGVKLLEVSLNQDEKQFWAYNAHGVGLLNLKEYKLAALSFNRAIGVNPSYVDAYFNLGKTQRELGEISGAIISYSKCIELDKNYANAFNNLGTIFLENLKDYDKSLENFQQFNKLVPNSTLGQNNLGTALYKLERYDEAIKCYDRTIHLKPDDIQAHLNRGIALGKLKRYDEAVKCYDQIILLELDNEEAHLNRGTALQKLKRYNDAIKSYKEVIKSNYANDRAYFNLGVIYSKLKLYDKAQKFYEKALQSKTDPKEEIFSKDNYEGQIRKYRNEIELDPYNAKTHLRMGDIFRKLQRTDEAAQSYDLAIKLRPNFVQAHINRGILFHKIKCHAEAVTNYSHALEVEPNNIQALGLRSKANKELDNYIESIKDEEYAAHLKPDTPYLLGSLLDSRMKVCNWYNFDGQRSEITKKIKNEEHVIGPFLAVAYFENPELHKSVTELYNRERYPLNKLFPKIKKYPRHKKIRIGYFSGDFRYHPVSTLTAELFELYDPNEFEIYAFSHGSKDYFTERLEKSFDDFISIEKMSDNDVVLLGRKIEIDIAVDLGGYSGNERIGIFARRVAPIQLSYIGYLGTMGSEYYDYLLADHHIIPKNMRKLFSEKIIYLPSFQVNDNKKVFPDKIFTRENLGLPKNGFVFCCFNNSYKILPSTFDSWMRILSRVDSSVLFLLAQNEDVKKNLQKEAIVRGIKPDRLIFGAKLSSSDYLARYRNADLFLDTSPYNAGATASDALRSELPLITLIGSSFASRHAASILNAVGLPELITESTQDYESLAVELATNPGKLSAIKLKLVKNLPNSLLLDTKLFSQNIENAYQKIYQRNQDGFAPDHIFIK
jgi:protein O-GlcNAc transferase